jgi:hypothetical protein
MLSFDQGALRNIGAGFRRGCSMTDVTLSDKAWVPGPGTTRVQFEAAVTRSRICDKTRQRHGRIGQHRGCRGVRRAGRCPGQGAPVERAIAHLKSWRILHTDYRRPLHTYVTSYRAVVGLYFFKLNFE